MYYICKKREEDGTFGIMDTSDGVVEYYSPKAIGKMIKQFHLEIEGAKIVDNKLKLTVKKPVQFEDRGTYDENGSEIPVLRATQRGAETSKLLNMSAQIVNKAENSSSLVRTGFVSSFDGLYEETLRSEFIEKLQDSAGFMIRALNKVINGIAYVAFDDIRDLDGWDCVGFEGIHVKNHPEFTVSIYTNPEVSAVESGNGHWKLKSVESKGFGVDLYKGREIIAHIDGSWKSWEEDIETSNAYRILYGGDSKENSITPLDEMPIQEFDEFVEPLFTAIYNVANWLLPKGSKCFKASDVQYLDGYDCVGIHYSAKSNTRGKVDISVISNGLLDYSRTGTISENIRVDYIFDDAVSNLFGTGEIGKKLTKEFTKYVEIDDNRIHVEIPETEHRAGLTAAVAINSLLDW